ncbi:uncharacterized protein LOC117107010 [Anneissia japonica]|uniref:uncharacterized protein LOC117107010 n=1 Tax=Anneissia japonica TaxID=1529436 RepID=UPI0014259BF4|nr:uncharacterized protein LOC117107010 [Anneissia japonica]
MKCHIKCGRISPNVFKQYQNCRPASWICPFCLLQELPGDVNISPDPGKINNYWDKLPFPFGFSNDDLSTTDTTGDTTLEGMEDYDFTAFNSKGLHHIHINIRSLPPKIEELRFLATKTNATTISVTETWLDHSVTDNEIHIDGYNLFRKDRNREGGGVCIYTHINRAVTRREDLEVDDMETVWVDVLLPRSKPITVGTCYRPPKSNPKLFIEHLENSTNMVCSTNELIILGDMNINTMKDSYLTRFYKSFISNNGLLSIINEVTRISKNSISCIEHILCKSNFKVRQSGIFQIGISDHFMVYCTRKKAVESINFHNTVHIRSLKKYDVKLYISKLQDIDWSSRIYNCCEVNIAWSNLKKILIDIVDTIAPQKQIRLKHKSQSWLNSDILMNIKLRDTLLKKNRSIRFQKTGLN